MSGGTVGHRVGRVAWEFSQPSCKFESGEGNILLTEAEVQRNYQRIVKKWNEDARALDRAEALVMDELRPESPLRQRFLQEIGELRKLVGMQA